MRDATGFSVAVTRRVIGFRRSRKASISVITALLLPVLVGMVALVAEFGNGLLTKSENQRVADLASYAGALAYGKDKSETAMRAAARGVAVLNHVAAADVTVNLVASPRAADAQAVNVNIATHNNLALARLLGTGPQLTITSQAFAEVGSGGKKPACILALSESQSGLTMSGGTAVNALECTVTSNSKIEMSGSAKITAKTVQYTTTLTKSGAASIVGTTAKVSTTSDPFATHEGIAATVARLSAVRSTDAPPSSTPSTGTSIDFAYNEDATKKAATTAGCTAAKSGSKWTLTCPPNGSYKFGTITLGGGLSVDFNVTGTSGTTYDFSGPVNAESGSPISFGPGRFNLGGGLLAEGDVKFGAGTFKIARHATPGRCAYSICVGGSRKATFGGPSTFELAAGFSVAGSATIDLGGDAANSFWIGSGTTGKAVSIDGSGTAYLGRDKIEATKISIAGMIDTGGSSCLVMSPAAHHDIKGNVNLVGGMLMGAGVYTVDGYFGAGSSAGGGGTCLGQKISIKGENVTLFVSGRERFPSGSCSSQALCFGAGFQNAALTAPKTGPLTDVALIGPHEASVTAGAAFVQGAAGSGVSGLLYFPNGPVLLNGGSSLGGVAGGCLQIVGSRIDLTGGTAAASECAGLGGSDAGAARKVSLVQ